MEKLQYTNESIYDPKDNSNYNNNGNIQTEFHTTKLEEGNKKHKEGKKIIILTSPTVQ